MLTLLAASALSCCKTLVKNKTKFTPTPKNANVARPWLTVWSNFRNKKIRKILTKFGNYKNSKLEKDKKIITSKLMHLNSSPHTSRPILIWDETNSFAIVYMKVMFVINFFYKKTILPLINFYFSITFLIIITTYVLIFPPKNNF